MTAIFRALKNSNVHDYVKARVLQSDLSYILDQGVGRILASMTQEIDPDDIVLYSDGEIEVNVYSDFYHNNDYTMFKESETKKAELRAIRKDSDFYQKNRRQFEEIKKIVPAMTAPVNRQLGKNYFGSLIDGISVKSNVEKYYYFDDMAFIAIRAEEQLPEKTKPFLEPLPTASFISMYERALFEA